MRTNKVVVSMQHCKNCNSRFQWKKVYRYLLLGSFFNPYYCNHCGKEHYVTLSGRLINVFLIVGPMVVFVQLLSPFKNIYLTIGVGILLGLLGSLLSPRFITFTTDEN